MNKLLQRETLVVQVENALDRHPDCALVIYPSIDRRQMELLLELPVPLLFDGDFLRTLSPNYPMTMFSGMASSLGTAR
jgi:hypothetical protein